MLFNSGPREGGDWGADWMMRQLNLKCKRIYTWLHRHHIIAVSPHARLDWGLNTCVPNELAEEWHRVSEYILDRYPAKQWKCFQTLESEGTMGQGSIWCLLFSVYLILGQQGSRQLDINRCWLSAHYILTSNLFRLYTPPSRFNWI